MITEESKYKPVAEENDYGIGVLLGDLSSRHVVVLLLFCCVLVLFLG